ncbi:hypothetical protein [Bradyrhizobium elkanii]|uniref:Uncharacterized protein n=1 Tax=Bradyrhizobium diazoefficiens TaxID=1355477 RepID=A0A810CVN4_9BRAD|nr:hypothetical protein [Bradyrhizobium elkanii]BCE22068.1 hypothetical protein XF1B_47490 [Bradyrhizobium diazoefficiens]WLB04125.1 hypothetical protein QNJ80_19930 [Bradyrhizobium elkanii]WLB84935.1 hypothetical protein QIH83_21260 [Bradyrhizobium elkanii]BCE48333.1 hypothetical protein XF4B_46820 [Bradyrhizobium diazoefficiens]BCE91849.1 hypothetical protein XF10B_46470 [Bradyrhizobium diazoefficiens]
MNPRYLPTTVDGKVARVVEESGEVVEVIGRCLRIYGKIGRFGLESTDPGGGPTNAAMYLSELADLRHAISQVENSLTDFARIKVGNTELVWTDTLIPTQELRELIGDEDHANDNEFNSANKVIPVCAGQWHREGLEWRFYVDPELD